MDVQVLKTYSHQGLCRAIDIFRHPEEFPRRTRLLGFRFLLQYRHMDTVLAPSKEKIIQEMRKMIDQYYNIGTQDAYSVLMELVDMLIDYSPKDGEPLLAYLREQRATANDDGPGVHDIGPECTVYGDSQSAHNKEINASTRKAAKYLATRWAPSFGTDPAGIQAKMQHYERVRENLIQLYSKTIPHIEQVIERIYTDNAHFDIGYTVDQVLMALLRWIDDKRTEYKKVGKDFPAREIFNRLGEEFAEMHNYCSSGLLCRIINSIQGFTDNDDNLVIRISDREQVKTVVYSYLNKAIQECGDDEVMDGLTEGGEKFIQFVKNTVADKVDDWSTDYGDDFLEHLMSVVNEYTSVMTYA